MPGIWDHPANVINGQFHTGHLSMRRMLAGMKLWLNGKMVQVKKG